MHAHTFDGYLPQVSPVHRLDPRVKVMIAILFILSTVLLPDGAWLAFVLSWLFVLGFTLLARLPYQIVFKRALIVLPFLFAAVTVVFTLPGNVVASGQVGPWQLHITDSGLLRFVSIIIRSWLAVQMAVLLTATTQFPDLMHALTHLHVPQVLVSIISFMYRYLFVLADEAMRLLRARQARSARLVGSGANGGSLVWRAKTAGSMVGQLFVRSLERSDRVYNAMLARGYQGRLLTINPHVMTIRDWRWLTFGVALVGALQLIGRFV